MGRHTKYGGYVVEWSKVRTYVGPGDMKGFMVSFSDERVFRGQNTYKPKFFSQKEERDIMYI